jgi:mannosylglycerate synthase
VSFDSRSRPRGSLVVIPFLEEDPELVVRNLAIAASHPAVGEVVAISGGHGDTEAAVRAGVEVISGVPTRLLAQRRIGTRRPGKGDAINTGFEYFLEREHWDRIHFYDSDIRTFGPQWITKAETAAGLGYQAIRHYYPRSPTDAMITWMVVRTGFALCWPDSELPWIHQPLSGELMFTRAAAATLAGDRLVAEQSDWGIDTVLTYASVAHGLPLYESYLAEGKDHALYGTLADIKTMMCECLAAVQRLRSAPPPRATTHRVEFPHRAAAEVTEKLGYDIEATQALLTIGWSDRQTQLLENWFTPEVVAGAKGWREWPDCSFLDEPTWFTVLRVLLDRFVLGDDDWEALAFRLWMGRVLHYTLRVGIRGHAYSMDYLNGMIGRAISSG